MEKLKPCPFCMSDDIQEMNDVLKVTFRAPEYWHKIYCNGCMASITRQTAERPEHARRAAVEAWNRRAHGGTAYMEGT